MATFHYIKHGRDFGPVKASELLQMVQQGVIAQTDLVRIHGRNVWAPANEMVANLKAGFLDLHVTPASPLRKPPVLSSRPPGSDTVFTTAPPPNASCPPHPSGSTAPRPALAPSHCGHCGHRFPRGANFCGHCGIAL